MSTISFSRYVRIRSGVIGAGGTTARELILRLITPNERVSPDEVLEFTTAADVGRYFGTDSEEYRRAAFYFGWVSPSITVAKKLSFGRHVPFAVAPSVFGVQAAPLAQIKALGATAAIAMTVGGVAYNFQGIDVSTAVSYADVATAVQTVMVANGDPMFATATVSYNATSGAFEFVGGVPQTATISVSAGPLANAMGWNSTDTLFISGATARSVVDSIIAADGISNNYFSCLVMGDVILAEHIEAAEALQAIDTVTYMYLVGALAADFPSWCAALSGIAGVAVGNKGALAENFVDMVPGVQAAATDYNNVGATSSYMYKEFNLPAVVDNDQDADANDQARCNYMGVTQRAGRKFSFYQRGVLMGPNTAPLDQNTYTNEAWLKETAAVQFMDLLRGLPKIPANETGRNLGAAAIQEVVQKALNNGVISVGKVLDFTQRAAITAQTNDQNAWRQVQSLGYWFNVVITKTTATSGIVEYTLEYLLIYSKDDTIRNVQGRHQLV